MNRFILLTACHWSAEAVSHSIYILYKAFLLFILSCNQECPCVKYIGPNYKIRSPIWLNWWEPCDVWVDNWIVMICKSLDLLWSFCTAVHRMCHRKLRRLLICLSNLSFKNQFWHDASCLSLPHVSEVSKEESLISVSLVPNLTSSPFYGEDFYCEIPRSFRHLSFYIFDRDVFRRDSSIGE